MTLAFLRPLLLALVLCAWILPSAEAERRGRRHDTMTTETLLSNGEERSYHVYRPARLSGPAPVIIMLHGGGGNGLNAAKMTGFNALADRQGFVAVYPNGTGRGPLLTWNGGHCCALAMEEAIDDVGFMSDLIDALVASGVADAKHIYVTGMSNGAIMAHQIGRQLPHKVAAIAPVVGSMKGDEPAGAGPIPVLIITGALDENVPPAGGFGASPFRKHPSSAPHAPAEAALDYWLSTNACAREAAPQTNKNYTLRKGEACAAPVEWVHLSKGTHSWPGGVKGHAAGDAPVKTYSASREIWAFFKTKTLSAPATNPRR